jgi:predicted nucleic acid-binding protein
MRVARVDVSRHHAAVAGNARGGAIRKGRRIGARLLDKILDHFVGVAIGFLLATGTGILSAVYHELAHRQVIISLSAGFAAGFLLSLVAAGIRALRDAAQRERYLEAQKELVYNALESIQQEFAIDDDWELKELVERGVLGPVRGLLMRARFEDVRLAVLVPTDDNPDEWTMRWTAGHSPEGVRNFRRNIDLMIAGRAYREGELVVCQDVLGDPLFVPNPRARREFRSLVAMPVQVNEQIVGVLSVISTEPNAFVDTDISFIRIVAGLIDVLLSAEHDAAAWEAYAAEQRAEAEGIVDDPPGD